MLLPTAFSDADGHVTQVMVGLEDHFGYFVVDVEQGETEAELVVLVDKNTTLDGADFHIAVVDDQGHVSDYHVRGFEVLETGVGDVKVSLFFDRDVDLDLHVVEPGGQEVYYSEPLSGTGGELDLDSNPACQVDDINNENIFWPEGAAPEGEYVVRVNDYAACQPEPVNYVVTIHSGDDVQPHSGTFDAADANGGGPGAGTEVARFTYGR